MGEFGFHTLRERITEAIRFKVLNGELAPGERIIEQKLAEEFHSSRGPIREALRQLEQEGLIEYSRNVGCSARKITTEDVYEIYLLRSSLEMAAIRHYECHFSNEEIQEMQMIVEQMQQLKQNELDEIYRLDREFHGKIINKAGLPRLMKEWEALNFGNLIAAAFSGPYRHDLAERQHVIHTDLLSVLKCGNTEEACQAIYKHYMSPVKKLLDNK